MDSLGFSQSSGASLASERRRWGRFVSRIGQVAVSAGDTRQPAEILDESIGGAAILLPDASPWGVGTAVLVEYDGVVLNAMVRNVLPQPSGQVRIGIQWVDGEQERYLETGSGSHASEMLAVFRAWQSGDRVRLKQSAETLARCAQRSGRDDVVDAAESLARRSALPDSGAGSVRVCVEELLVTLNREGHPGPEEGWSGSADERLDGRKGHIDSCVQP